MLKRWVILLALAATVALPFLLRPKQGALERADETLVIITPHNESIRHEFSLGFRDWYLARTGKHVNVDWRVVGGTSDIARYLEGEYISSFRNLWVGKLGRSWSGEVQAGFQRIPDSGSPDSVRQAREVFMESSVSCGIDLFFGGGPFDFDRQARAGRLVDSGLLRLHPDWFSEHAFPRTLGGQTNWDTQGRWFGTVLNSYGIVANRDALRRIGFDRIPSRWSDLADPRFLGEVGLADPTKSGSSAVAFENVVQQAMQQRLSGLRTIDPKAGSSFEAKAVHEGWVDGLRLIQLIGANARYFTDASQKPPIDVASGDCAAGMCIDFYGREQQEAVRRRSGSDRLAYSGPEGGSAYSADPIGLLRGAPHRELAVAFIEYVLSLDGQKLWNFRPGTPGGPRDFALRQMPARRDFYEHGEWMGLRTDPDENPYHQKMILVYHPERTGSLYLELAFIVRTMCEDSHPELVRAWKAILASKEPARSNALEVLQDMSAVDYEHARGSMTKALTSKDPVDAIILARTLGETFRRNYERAEQIAQNR